MNQNDDKFKALLKQWRDIEPKSNFEANVWRRIRLAEAEKPQRATLGDLFGWLARQPAWVAVAALVVSATISASVGFVAVSDRSAAPNAELQFMSEGTLAGGYLKIAQEGRR